MKIFRFILLIAVAVGLAAPVRAQQMQGAQWFFGQHIGIDFTSGPPRFSIGGQTTQYTSTGSSVCDAAGNLQFYTDGIFVWNRHHQRMPSGFIAALPGYTQGHTTLTIPRPLHPNEYYVRTYAKTMVGSASSRVI
jgi:hypothetical protein